MRRPSLLLSALGSLLVIAGMAMTFTGIWLADAAMGAVITGGSILLLSGALVVGFRRRRAGIPELSQEEAVAKYRQFRQHAIFMALGVPVIVAIFIVYKDELPETDLIVGGLLVSFLGGVPSQLRFLADLRERAVRA